MARFEFATFHVQAPPTEGIPQAKERDIYLRLIDLLFRSALEFHPDAQTTILTDRATDLSSIKAPFKRNEHVIEPRHLMLARALAQLKYVNERPFDDALLLLDSDMLVNGSLTHLLSEDFDVALTWRVSPDMPINGGFMLLQSRRPAVVRSFFEEYTRLYLARYTRQSVWFGDQLALRDLVALPCDLYGKQDVVNVNGCRVRLLPCAGYNYSPRNRTRSVLRPLPGPMILHFKSSRKRLMPLYYEAHRSGRRAAIVLMQYYLERKLGSWLGSRNDDSV